MEVKDKLLNIKLSIDVINDDVIGNLVFSNESSHIIYLDVWTVGIHDLLTSSIFSIIDDENNYVPYYGMMGSRKIVREDFVALNQGESLQTKVVINKDYKLIKGYKYIIKFCAYNPALTDVQARLTLLSNKVEITY
jgi:hypothetical protein